MNASAATLSIPGPLRRFSVAEYHQLIEAGLFEEDERVELLEGWIVAKMTRKPPHDAVLAQIAELLRALIPSSIHVRVQSAITTADSEPEPDVALVRGAALDYMDHHPGPTEVALIVEVADSSVDRDRAKARVYARAGIPAYWLVNLAEGWIEVYEEPSGEMASPVYHRRTDCSRGSQVRVVLDGATIGTLDVSDVIVT